MFANQKTNFDERAELAQTVATAIGRRDDQIVLDAALASGTAKTVSEDLGGLATNLNFAKIRKAKALLDQNDVPTEGRVFVMHPNNLEALLSETSATSSDFVTIKALVNGEINQWMGFTFVRIGDRDEGGLPLATGIRTCLAWHKQAIGMAEGLAMRTAVDWIPTRVSHLVNAMFSAGAIAIDPLGIVEISCDDDAAASVP